MTSLAKLYSRPDASKYLDEKRGVKRSASTLAKLASVGGGPKFRRLNRAVYYEESALDEWVLSRLSPPLSSTSDVAASKTGS